MTKERDVVSYFDPELANQYRDRRRDGNVTPVSEMTEDEAKEYKRQEEESQRGMSRNSLRNMGFASALDKDERKFKLISAIRKKEIQTIQASASYMGLSESTIRNYLREENVGVYDAKIKDYLRFNEDTEIIEFDFDRV